MPPKKLSQISGMPKMNAVFNGWTFGMQVILIRQSIENGFVTAEETPLKITGIWQPFSPEQIQLMPEGQRSWEWVQFHVKHGGPIFQTNDRIRRAGITYKVMAAKDFKYNNYTAYDLIRDYEANYEDVPAVERTGMPQMSAAFDGWMVSMNLIKISQTIIAGLVSESRRSIKIKAAWQPLSPEEIALKPDGQRSWEWIDLHVRGRGQIFATNDRIEHEGILYKIMAVKDWRLNNYTEYHLIRDYEPAPESVPNYVFVGANAVYDGPDRVIDGFEGFEG